MLSYFYLTIRKWAPWHGRTNTRGRDGLGCESAFLQVESFADSCGTRKPTCPRCCGSQMLCNPHPGWSVGWELWEFGIPVGIYQVQSNAWQVLKHRTKASAILHVTAELTDKNSETDKTEERLTASTLHFLSHQHLWYLASDSASPDFHILNDLAPRAWICTTGVVLVLFGCEVGWQGAKLAHPITSQLSILRTAGPSSTLQPDLLTPLPTRAIPWPAGRSPHCSLRGITTRFWGEKPFPPVRAWCGVTHPFPHEQEPMFQEQWAEVFHHTYADEPPPHSPHVSPWAGSISAKLLARQVLLILISQGVSKQSMSMAKE